MSNLYLLNALFILKFLALYVKTCNFKSLLSSKIEIFVHLFIYVERWGLMWKDYLLWAYLKHLSDLGVCEVLLALHMEWVREKSHFSHPSPHSRLSLLPLSLSVFTSLTKISHKLLISKSTHLKSFVPMSSWLGNRMLKLEAWWVSV